MTHTDLTTTNRPMRSQRRRPWPVIGAAALSATAVLAIAECAERSVEPPHSYSADGGGPTRSPGDRAPSAGSQLIPASKPVQPARSGVPKILVGIWDGGSKPNQADISFSPAGGLRLTYPSGLVIDGIVVVDGSAITFYLPGGNQQTLNWSVEKIDTGYGYAFLNLSLDGHSYVRQISG